MDHVVSCAPSITEVCEILNLVYIYSLHTTYIIFYVAFNFFWVKSNIKLDIHSS